MTVSTVPTQAMGMESILLGLLGARSDLGAYLAGGGDEGAPRVAGDAEDLVAVSVQLLRLRPQRDLEEVLLCGRGYGTGGEKRKQNKKKRKNGIH